MKKTLFVLVALLFATTGVLQAQYLSYGAKLGLSFPGFQDERIASERITPAVSFAGSVHLSRSFQIQLELGYELKGNKFTYEIWDQTSGALIEDSVYDVKTNLSYVTVPLFLKYNLGRSNKFYGQIGGYYGYLVSANYTGKRFDEMLTREPIRSGLAVHDYGLLIGGGLETPVRRGLSMLIDVKYHYGLKDLNTDPLIIGHSNPVRNKSFVMSMGVIIDVD